MAVAGRPAAPLRVPAARGGLGALRGADGRGGAPDPGAGRDRHPQVLQRPGVVHARTTSSCWGGRPSSTTASSAPASTRSASRPRAARAGRWPSGSSRASRRRDQTGVDVRRFAPFNGDHAWLRDRVAEILGLHYALPWPNREPVTARDVRQSPVHARAGRGRRGLRLQDGLGAPQRLRAGARRGPRLLVGQAVLAAVVRGRAAGRPRGGRGLRPDVVLQVRRRRPAGARRRCSGSARPTSTYRSGTASTRRGSTSAAPTRPTSPSPGTARTASGSSRRPPPRCATSTGCAGTAASRAVDVTDAFAVLGVMGPASRDLLGRISSDDWSEDGFPFATSRTATVGRRPAPSHPDDLRRRARLGADRPGRDAGAVYDALFGEGADLGVSNAGYYTIDSLRLEKGFRAFPRELSPDYTPGRGRAGLRHRAEDRQAVPRPRGARGPARPAGRGRSATPAGLVRARGPRPDALGRRAAAPRRPPGRARSPAPPGARRSAPRSGWPTSAPTAR